MKLKSVLQFPKCPSQTCRELMLVYFGVCCFLTRILFICLFQSVENRFDFLTDILTSALLSSVPSSIAHLLHLSIYR